MDLTVLENEVSLSRIKVRALVKCGNEYLFIQRCRDGKDKKYLTFPGGRVKKSDRLEHDKKNLEATLKSALVRELEEELGATGIVVGEILEISKVKSVNPKIIATMIVDLAATWTKLADGVGFGLDAIKLVSGDLNEFGTVYVGTSAAGVYYGKPSGNTTQTVPPTTPTVPPTTPTVPPTTPTVPPTTPTVPPTTPTVPPTTPTVPPTTPTVPPTAPTVPAVKPSKPPFVSTQQSGCWWLWCSHRMNWKASTGGTGKITYVVTVDIREPVRVDGLSTQINWLPKGKTYPVSIYAVDGAGKRSDVYTFKLQT